MLNWHINKLSPLDIQYWDACPQIDSKVSQFQVETTCVGAGLQRSLDLFDKADISDSFFSPLEAPVLLVLRLAAAVHTRVQARPRARAKKCLDIYFYFVSGNFAETIFLNALFQINEVHFYLFIALSPIKVLLEREKVSAVMRYKTIFPFNNIIW